jgi:hypothetical protein
MSAVAELPAPIAGVSPPELRETTIMTIFPSIGGTGFGQLLGRLWSIEAGVSVLTVGNLLQLASIPLVLPMILHKFLINALAGIPVIGFPFGLLADLTPVRRYMLTNRRIMVAEGLLPKPMQYVELDRFDRVEMVVQPGQAIYPCADLIFFRGQVETFRLTGVKHAETFRQTCLKARNAFVGVKAARGF